MSAKYIFEKDTSETIDCSDNCKISVVTNMKQFKDFFKVSWIVYKDDDAWVPPLWVEYKEFFRLKNPFWNHAETCLFVAYKKTEPVGRIGGFIDEKYIESTGKKIGFFGFFECIKDEKMSFNLLEAARKWLISKDIDIMMGPFNGRVDVGCGILYKGFDSDPYIYGTYSPKYYINLLENYKMKKCKDLVSYYLDINQPVPDSIKKSTERCLANGFKIRRFNRLRANNEKKWWIKLIMDIFSHHWGYVNVSEEEVRNRFGIKELRWIVDTGLFLVVTKDKEPVAFKWSLPDYNQVFKGLNGRIGLIGGLKFLINKNKINRGKFNFVGVKKEYRGQGIASLMNYYVISEMKKRGYKTAEIGWIDEDNINERKATEKIGAKLYKIYRVYDKKIK
jgi:predicted GNAT family acetyltransferase